MNPNAPLAIEADGFLQPAQLWEEAQSLEPALAALREELASRRQELDPASFFALPFLTSELEKALYWAHRIRQQASRMVVFGIGGSSLGAETLISLAGGDGLPVRFYDNVDPEYLAPLALMDWRECFLLVVSKSGETAETVSQLLTTLPTLEQQLGSRIKEQMAVITENPDSSLGRIAAQLGVPVIPHLAVGGRFSVLSVTGLLPAAVAGVGIEELLAGARAMAQRCLEPQWEDNPPFRLGAAQYLMARQGRTQSVVMYYGERLGRLAAWFTQLWAESLGKIDPRGHPLGLTPIMARGVSDQHSQLQLFLDGPREKQFTFLWDTTLAHQGRTIPSTFAQLPAVEPLAGRTTGELFDAERRGTRDALLARQFPVRTLNLPSGSPHPLGELLMLWQAETVVVARLLGVNPYDQPAVEDSKRRARDYLRQSPRRPPMPPEQEKDPP